MPSTYTLVKTASAYVWLAVIDPHSITSSSEVLNSNA